MASPYSLRSHGNEQQSPPEGPPELIPCRQGTSREGTGASNGEAQTTFLEMVGLLERAETTSTEPTLSHEDAAIFSCALNHCYYDDMDGEDKFFTPDEHTRVLLQQARIGRRYALTTEEAVQQGTSISNAQAEVLLQEYKDCPKVCCCAAHLCFRASSERYLANRSASDGFYANSLGKLISLPPALNDHFGYELAGALLPFLLKAVEDDFEVKACLPGSQYTVNFVLRMPSGRAYQFTGRPDFTIDSSHRRVVTRYTLRAVGEVQSPPGMRRRESKTAALSQAGIYTVGQFAKKTGSRLPAIVLHKDKTVQVAMASLNDSDKTTENSLGAIAFKLVGQVDPIDLKDPEGLRIFSGLLKGVMEAT